ncbi:MAG: hypothetical protein WB507_01665 [Solirubrobacterales bacterium]
MSPLTYCRFASFIRTRATENAEMRRAICGLSAVVCLVVAMGLPLSAAANTPIVTYAAIPSTTQAGGHPDLETSFTVKNREVQSSRSACNCEDAKDATVHLPAGFIGSPRTATPQCTLAEFTADTCAIDSQVGIANIGANVSGLAQLGVRFDTAIYNLVPPPDEAALLGFKVFAFNTPTFIVLSARTGTDYGLDAETTSISHIYPLLDIQQVLWGVPAAHSHDPLRLDSADNLEAPGLTAYQGELCNASGEPLANETDEPIINDEPKEVIEPCELNGFTLPPISSNSPEVPLLQNPTTCESSLSSSFEVLSYDGGLTTASDPWPPMTGCDQLSFNPSLYAQPTTTATDTASGIDVDLEVPQNQSPSVPSPSELRAATVTLPEGFSINPGAADGKTACTDAEALIGPFASEAEAHCPEDSKVGSLTIESSTLPGPLPGYVYLGQPEPGNRYRIFLVANGFGTHIKLAGTVTPDPQTGRLTISFTELPQTPFTSFYMHFFGSERGLLATPTQCGTYPVESTFTPWDSFLSRQTSTQFFQLKSDPGGASCPNGPRPFTPSFQAGSTGHITAGAHAPFTLEITRPDGNQNLTGLTVTTPPGFSATLKGIPYCPDAALDQAAAPAYSGLEQEANSSCPPGSQIGTSVAGAGAGTHPVYLPGRVYLAGPYKGAPLSLAVITPAVSGPYDLGNVVIRAALHVNPETAQITAVSDPLPLIHEGIPLRLRSVRVELNRPDFTLNPTNCDPFSVNTEISGSEGALASPSAHFQVANCGTLPFSPKLSVRLAGSTKQAGNPALTATLTASPGEANISRTQVTLPHTEFVDNAHISDPCTRVQFAEGQTPGEKCPPGSVLGFAHAETPLLANPLEGPIYLRSTGRAGLPDVVAALNGQIDITLDGHVDSVGGRLRTTFPTVPDAPITKAILSFDGGHKGIIENSPGVCSHPLHVTAKITGQNGKSANQNPVLSTPCVKKHNRKHTRHPRAAHAHRVGRR